MAKVTQAEANYRDGTASQTFGRLAAPVEFKFAPDGTAEPGTFGGYANVFNRIDWHGDITLPGAFAAIARRSQGGWNDAPVFTRSMASRCGVEIHCRSASGSGWRKTKGAAASVGISALDSDHGKRMVGLMRDGALPGLSISYEVADGDATFGTKPGEPKRWLKQLKFYSVDVVSNPSNPDAQISSVKSLLALGDHAAALAAIKAALALHQSTMMGGDAPTADERAQLSDHLRAAHRALAGDDPKAAPETIREFEAALHGELHYSHRIAREIAARGWKAAHEPRDEAAAVAEATDALRGSAEALRRLTFAA
jgi:HK97 family phage prohead protease